MVHAVTCLVIGLQGVPLVVPTAPELKFIDPVVVHHNVPASGQFTLLTQPALVM